MAILLIILLAASSGLYAGTSPSVRYLKREPLTLWDWGIISLETLLREHCDWLEGTTDTSTTDPVITYGFHIFARVSYWAERDRLLIMIQSQSDTTMAEPSGYLEASCKALISQVKERLQVDDNGRPRSQQKASLLGAYFAHRSFFLEPDRPEDLSSQLDSITEIRVVAGASGRSIGCRSMLLDSEVQYTDRTAGFFRP